ncbi:MAG TPA: TonB-dependent receptor [Vicinamibacteria bacterium]|nr:TonB-dependent receptor [Vicinamibacteria bacterium]
MRAVPSIASALLLSTLVLAPAHALFAEGPPQAPSAPTPASSDENASRPPQAAEAAPVFYETTTVTARPVSSATGGLTVLDAREIEASAARSGSDLAHEVPGLNLLSSGSRAGVSNAYVRGSDPNFTLVLLDGIPLNDATEEQGGAVNLEELPAGLVDHVEVVRGPLTSFYGTNALAGVIQLFTPRGKPGPLRTLAGLEAGDFDQRRAFGRLSGGQGRDGWAAGASWDEEQHRVGDDRFRQLDTWANGDLAFGANGALALTGRFDDGTSDDYPDTSGGPVYGSGLLRHTDHRDFDAAARLELGDPGGRRQHLFAGFAWRDLQRSSPAVPPVVPESTEHTTFWRLRLGWQMPLVRSARTEIDAGLAAESEHGDNTSLLELPPALGGDVPGDYTRTRTTVGAFAGARHESGPLLYEAALRVDAVTGGTVQANPHGGIVFRPGEGDTRLHVSGGRASKLPSFFALFSPRALGGNPDLEPEYVWGGEAGIEHRLRRARLDLGVTCFVQDLRNLIDFDFQQFLNVNRAHVRSQGVELTARWQPHPTLALEAEATWLDVRDLSGTPLLQQPRWVGGGWLTWRPLPTAMLRVQGRGSSGYLDFQYPVPDRDSVAGYGLVAASGSWRFGNGITLRARGDNLTNRRYETFIGFPGPSRSFWAGIGYDR